MFVKRRLSETATAGDAGFTLIEALIALILMGVATAIVSIGYTNGRIAKARSAEVEAALALARSKLAEASVIAKGANGREQGRDRSGLRWEVVWRPYAEPGRATPSEAVSVTAIVWTRNAAGQDRQPIRLTTLSIPKEDDMGAADGARP